MDEEFTQELEAHLAMLAEEGISRGMAPEDARRAARVRLGGMEQLREIHRQQWGLPLIETFLQDIRYGLRMLCKSPAFTIVAVLTLALGTGANTAIFSVVNSVLLRDLPVRDPQQLVFLTNPNEQGMEQGFADGDRDFLTYWEFQQLEQNNRVFSGLLASSSFAQSLPIAIEDDGESRELVPEHVSLVSGSYFSVLGISPILGRAFTNEVDKVRNANPVAVISYGFWRDHFARSAAALGRRIRIHDTSFTIIGVMPLQFRGETVGVSPEIWVPLSMQAEIYPGRDYLALEPQPFHKSEWLQAIGRLKPNVTLAQAKASINVEFHQLMESQTVGMSADKKRQFLNQHLAVVEGRRGASTLREDFGKPLEILMAIVGLILLIACANIANILLARSAARQKEITVRVAVGASASRLLRQVFTESILLALIGGAVGLVLARWADAALLHMVSRGPSPIPLDVHPDARVLMFTLGVSVLTGILFGLAPGLRARRVELGPILRGTSHTVAGSQSRVGGLPIGKALVVAQVALSLLLLVVAALFVRSFQRLAEVQLGFDRDHILTFSISPISYGYRAAEIPQLYKDIIERLDSVPGVRSASLIDNGLFAGTNSRSPIVVEGEKPKTGDEAHSHWDLVGPNFFSTAGIPILYGREIGPQDSGNGQRVGVVNEEFVRGYFAPRSNPIGKRVHVHTTLGGVSDFVIVGVAANAKQGSLREKPRSCFYVPFLNPIGEASYANIIVRTTGDPAEIVSSIRTTVKQTATNLPPIEIKTMKEIVSQTLGTDRMITQLSFAFGVLAIVLVCTGLYGIMAYAVCGRINEIGIRIALGAQRGNVLWLILQESLVLVLIGVVIALPVVLGAGKWISSLLYGVTAVDPAALTFATILMFVVGMFACYVPARRATRVDPIVALRYE
jgi:predicted permease